MGPERQVSLCHDSTAQFVSSPALRRLLSFSTSSHHPQGHYSEAEAAAVMRVLLDFTEHAHREGIIHRDLKPHNILLLNEVRLMGGCNGALVCLYVVCCNDV